MKKEANRKNIKKKSIFGIISLVAGCISFGFIFVYTYRFGIWLIENEVYKNPRILEGKKIPESIESLIDFLAIIVLIGFLSGIIGLIEKKKKLASIIGTILNGLFLIIFLFKL